MKVKDLFVPIVLASAGLFAYHHFTAKNAGPTEIPASGPSHAMPAQEEQSWRSDRVESAAGPANSQFKCDDRTHCSHMTSCAEAKYFIKHCPNTKMDGNHDGVPCEKQWCGGQ